jgi:hypothetical protein
MGNAVSVGGYCSVRAEGLSTKNLAVDVLHPRILSA